MRRKLWMLLLLLLAVPSQSSAQFMPPPIPNPLPLPSCPMRHFGTVGEVSYWGTGTCPSESVIGFGQTTGSVTPKCMKDIAGANTNVCNTPIRPVVLEDTVVNRGGYKLTACDSTDGPDDKLQKIIKECETLEKYLRKIIKKNTEHTADHISRIEKWQAYLSDVIDYLRESKDPTDQKIAYYCVSTATRKSVVAAFREHEAAWSVSYLDFGATSKRAHVFDKQQPGELKSADDVKPVAYNPNNEHTNSVQNISVYKVTVNDSSDEKTVYFKTFTFQDNSGNYMHYGVQVSDPGCDTPVVGEFKNRNTYGHVIKSESGGKVYLVSSVDDLSVPIAGE